MRTTKNTVTAKNYNSILNPTPKKLLNFIQTQEFRKIFFQWITKYIEENPEIESDTAWIKIFNTHVISCLLKILKGEGIDNEERWYLDAFINMWAMEFLSKNILKDFDGDFLQTHLFWSLYSNARITWILDEIQDGLEGQKIDCVALFWDYGLYEVHDEGSIDYVVLDKNMRMVQSRDIFDVRWNNLLTWDPEKVKELEANADSDNPEAINPFISIDAHREISIVIENSNKPVEIWHGSIEEGFTRTICEQWKISGREFHGNVVEILTPLWLIELYVMSTGECIFAQSENEVQEIREVVGPDTHKVVHYLWIHEGVKDVHFVTDSVEMNTHIMRSAFGLHLFPHNKGAVAISYNPSTESYILVDPFSETTVLNIMSFRNRKWDVFFGGEIPVYIMDSWDIWLAYSVYNDDNSETLWHFTTADNSDRRKTESFSLESISPSRYNN